MEIQEQSQINLNQKSKSKKLITIVIIVAIILIIGGVILYFMQKEGFIGGLSANCKFVIEQKKLSDVHGCSEEKYTLEDGKEVAYIDVSYGPDIDWGMPDSYTGIVEGDKAIDYFWDKRGADDILRGHGDFCVPSMNNLDKRNDVTIGLARSSNKIYPYQLKIEFRNFHAAIPWKKDNAAIPIPDCILNGTLYIHAYGYGQATGDDSQLKYSYNNVPSQQDCENSALNSQDRGTCYYIRAVVSGDISLCKYAGDTGLESSNLCYLFLAVQKKSPELCSSISDDHIQSWCYGDVASVLQDSEICKLASDYSIRDDCIASFEKALGIYAPYNYETAKKYLDDAVKLGDPVLCQKIEHNEQLQIECITEVATKLQRPEYCNNFITESFWKQSCTYDVYLQRANDSNDLSYCDKTYAPEGCRRNIYKSLASSAECSRFQDLYKNECMQYLNQNK